MLVVQIRYCLFPLLGQKQCAISRQTKTSFLHKITGYKLIFT
jgi:hypothetical protein